MAPSRCLWTCRHGVDMFYIFGSHTPLYSFWSIMDHSKQAPHFELGKLGEGEAAGKVGEDAISL